MFVDIRRGVRYGAGEWDSAGCPQHQPSPLVVYTWSSPAQLYTLHTSVQAAGSSTAAQTPHSTGQCLYPTPGRHRVEGVIIVMSPPGLAANL